MTVPFFLAVCWGAIFYPAVMSADSLALWEMAKSGEFSSWHPPLLAFLMRISWLTFSSPTPLAIFQGCLFWLSILTILQSLTRSRLAGFSLFLIVCLTPPLWIYSNALITVGFGTSCLLFASHFALRRFHSKAQIDQLYALIFFSVALLFRREFVIFLPIFLALPWLSHSHSIYQRLRDTILALALVLLPSLFIEKVLVTQEKLLSPMNHSILLQYVGTLQQANQETLKAISTKDKTWFDEQFGEQTFSRLLSHYDCRTGDPFIWEPAAWNNNFVPILGRKGTEKKYTFPFLKMALTSLTHNPFGYLRHQSCYLLALGQFSELQYQDFGVFRENKRLQRKRKEQSLSFRSLFPETKEKLVALVKRTHDSPHLNWMYRHYGMLLFALISIPVSLFIRREDLALLALMAISYPAAYLLLGPNSVWRYLLPSYLLAYIVALSLTYELVRNRLHSRSH